MKNKILKLDEYGMCCPQEQEECPVDTSCNKWKDQYSDYMDRQACKPEEKFEFNLCDYDPNEVYFMQYRSKRAFYNEWWKEYLFEEPYNIKKHKYPKETE